MPWRREWLPTQVFFPGKSHGQKELGKLQSMGSQESDTTKQKPPPPPPRYRKEGKWATFHLRNLTTLFQPDVQGRSQQWCLLVVCALDMTWWHWNFASIVFFQKNDSSSLIIMIGWHHQLHGHEFEQTVGDSRGQGSLACCNPCSCKVSGMTEQLSNKL